MPVVQEIPAGEDVTVPVPAPAKWTVSMYVGPKVALTDRSALIVRSQELAPVQSPPQAVRAEPGFVAAVSERVVPSRKATVQVPAEQSSGPSSAPVDACTVPLPVPLTVTVSVCVRVKEAVAERSPESVSGQVPPPAHAPLQPSKYELVPVLGFRATGAPSAKVALQLPTFPTAHEMPAGEEVTLPLPVPETVIERVRVRPMTALRLMLPPSVTLQAPVPEQAPPQPPKVDPALGLAVSVTSVFWGKLALQVPTPPGAHEMPAGEEVTAPAPLPVTVTLSVWGPRRRSPMPRATNHSP